MLSTKDENCYLNTATHDGIGLKEPLGYFDKNDLNILIKTKNIGSKFNTGKIIIRK